MARPALLTLLLVLAASCAARPAPLTGDTHPASPLARAALAEWESWGRVVVIGWPDTRPPDTAATSVRFARLLDYWAVVPGGPAIARRLFDRRAALWAGVEAQGSAEPQGASDEERVPADGAGSPALEDIGLYAHPAWSAAFIAAIARRAGVPESDLPSSASHARFLDALLLRALAHPDEAAFLPYAPEERSLAAGDLVCFDRSLRPLAHWSQRLGELGRFRPMHCDVVVRTGPFVVEAVGGNVEDLVVLRRLGADAEGRVAPTPPGRPVALLIMATRSRG